MDTKIEQGKALKRAYAFARAGNFVWCQHFINHANAFQTVSKRQIAHAQKLYNAALIKESSNG